MLNSLEAKNEKCATPSVDESFLAKKRIVSRFFNSEILDSYKVIRTQVLQQIKNVERKTILITSAREGEGKSLTSLNLAITFGMVVDQFRSAIIIETDLRKPCLQKILALSKTQKGLADYLLDNTPVEDILVRPSLKNVSVICAGRPVPNSYELLGSKKMRDLIQEVEKRYPDRYVILDSPSLLQYPDSQLLSEFVDIILVVVKSGATSILDVIKAKKKLAPKEITGFILNQSR